MNMSHISFSGIKPQPPSDFSFPEKVYRGGKMERVTTADFLKYQLTKEHKQKYSALINPATGCVELKSPYYPGDYFALEIKNGNAYHPATHQQLIVAAELASDKELEDKAPGDAKIIRRSIIGRIAKNAIMNLSVHCDHASFVKRLLAFNATLPTVMALESEAS